MLPLRSLARKNPLMPSTRQDGHLSRSLSQSQQAAQNISSVPLNNMIQAPQQEQLVHSGSKHPASDERSSRLDRHITEVSRKTPHTTAMDARNRPLPQTPDFRDHDADAFRMPRQSHRQELWNFVTELPQPADDQTISNAAQQVFSLVDQYVDNFYIDICKETLCMNDRFQALEFPYLLAGSAPAVVIQLVSAPTIVIKHCLVYILLCCITFDNDGPYPSLLPVEFTALARALRNDETPVQYSALSAYRVLLSFLRPKVLEDEKYQTLLDESTDEIWNSINSTFRPWLDPKHTKEEREQVFEALMFKTAQLGLLLFAQPCTFNFNWDPKPSSSRDFEIAIAPRLLKINDEAAKALKPSQLMLNITTRRTSQVAIEDPQNRTTSRGTETYDPEMIEAWIEVRNESTHDTYDERQYHSEGEDPQLPPADPSGAGHYLNQPQQQHETSSHPVYELHSDSRRPHELDATGSGQHVNSSYSSSPAPHLALPLIDASFNPNEILARHHDGQASKNHSRSHTYPTQDSLTDNRSPYVSSAQTDAMQAHQTSQEAFKHQMDQRRSTQPRPPNAYLHPATNGSVQVIRTRSSHERRSVSADRFRDADANRASRSRRSSVSNDLIRPQNVTSERASETQRPQNSGIPHGVLPDRPRGSQTQESRHDYPQHEQPVHTHEHRAIDVPIRARDTRPGSSFDETHSHAFAEPRDGRSYRTLRSNREAQRRHNSKPSFWGKLTGSR